MSHAWVGTRYMGERGQPSQCNWLLVIWAPGSWGEILPFSSCIELRGSNLRLEVTHNPGTGWLYDSMPEISWPLDRHLCLQSAYLNNVKPKDLYFVFD